MRDKLLLLMSAGVASLLAWLLWHHLQDEAYLTISLLALAGAILDNMRLRRRLRGREGT